MGKAQWNNLDDNELERTLTESIDELPMEDIVENVVPLKSAMLYVLAGLVLSSVVFSFFKLNYILPTVGAVLSFLGYRKLKSENKYFSACYAIELVSLIYILAVLILNTMTLGTDVHVKYVLKAVSVIMAGVSFAGVLCLWLALRQVQKKAGLEPGAYAVLALAGLYALAGLLAVFGYGNVNLITMVITIAVFAVLIRAIYKLPRELDEAGYLVRTSRIIIPDKAIVIAVLAVLVTGGACGYMFGNGYRMAWSIRDDVQQGTDIEGIREELIAQGFPDYVLNDLTAEEIASCGGAVNILTQNKNCDNGLQFTDVAVQVQDADVDELWIIFHYFRWIEDKKPYGAEAVQIWTTEHEISEGWLTAGEVKGRLLYDRGGVTYTAPYHSMESVTYNRMAWIDRVQTVTDVFGTFSFPRKGENCRGYVSYSTVHTIKDYTFYDFINYTYQESWWQYPVISAYDHRTNGVFSKKPFMTVQNPFSFYFEEDGIRQY